MAIIIIDFLMSPGAQIIGVLGSTAAVFETQSHLKLSLIVHRAPLTMLDSWSFHYLCVGMYLNLCVGHHLKAHASLRDCKSLSE